jgi:hypothetical protein
MNEFVSRLAAWHIDDIESMLQQKALANGNFDVLHRTKGSERVLFSTAEVSFPDHFKLLNKNTLRSKKDMELGKMNLLIQTKLLPLEGDSSTKLHRGKWWIKDSSAVHFIPLVQVVCVKHSRNGSFFVCKITNLSEHSGNLEIANYGGDLHSAPVFLNAIGKFDYGRFGHRWKVSSPGFVKIALEPYEDDLLKDEVDESDLESILSRLKSSPDSGNGWNSCSKANISFIQIPMNSDFEDTDPQEAGLKENLLLFSMLWKGEETEIPLTCMITFRTD